MSDVQISDSCGDRIDRSYDQVADCKSTSSRSWHGKICPKPQHSSKLTVKTEKVFDIACAVADVLPFVSMPASQMELGPVDYLTQVVSLLAKLPGGADKFVPLLLAKINELRPELINTLCVATQLPLTAFNDPMSPDTRFVYEEEVGRGLYADLRRAV